MTPKINLLTEKIYPSLLRFATPLLLMWLQTSVFGMIDLLIISNFTDTFAIDAVAGGISVMNIITYTIAALTTGGGILIGQYLGAKRYEDVKKLIGNMFILLGAIGLVIATLMASLSSSIATWLNLDGLAKSDGFNYLLITAAGIPFIMGFNIIASQLRAFGNSRSPFLFLLLAASVNILLDLLFVALLNMRAAGAALASVISQISSFTAAILYLKAKNFPVRLTKKDIRFDGHFSKLTLRTGLPLALQDGIVLLSFTVILALINLYGAESGSGFGISEKITFFCFVPLNAFSAALTATTAQNLGAKQLERAKQYARAGLLMQGLMVTVIVIICEIFAPQLVSLFTSDANIIFYASSFIRIIALDALICIFIYVLNALFMGSGHTTFSMMQNVLSTLLIRLPLAFVFVFVLRTQVTVVAFAYPLASVFSLIACLIYYKLGRWKIIKESKPAALKRSS
ncbi:MAG: MATE family efflux transporter [Bacilli bacterium]|nr:MATE family efflux transporter [Bacilli bacterium]